MRRPLWIALAVSPCLSLIPDALARDLTFEERVNAQEAIERVHYSHQIGVTKLFEVAVPRAVLEAKVRTYLEGSVALQEYWKTPITAQALTRELERMAGNTRLPDRLREIYAALGNDRGLILECVARPALADRLARNFFAFDETIHGTEKQKAEEMRRLLRTGEISIHENHPLRTFVHFAKTDPGERSRVARAPAAGDGLLGTHSRIELDPDAYSRIRTVAPVDVGAIGAVTEERDAFVIRVVLDETSESFSLATYAVSKITWDAWWALRKPELDETAVVGTAAAPRDTAVPAPTCKPGDVWSNGSLDVAPGPRTGHIAVWTGTEMIVWGGTDYGARGSGGRYDPPTDTWSAMSTANAPSGGEGRPAVWTGTEMIVWGYPVGGYAPTLGGRYNPATDTWFSISTTNAPEARYSHSLVWTGTRMIVWGGYRPGDLAADPIVFGSGGLYDPATDTWSPISMTDAPAARLAHSAVWTGNRMIIWGGLDLSTRFNSGSLYDPATDTWSPISAANAPEARAGHSAFWTGTEMIVWGGIYGSFLNSGGRYDPATDTWAPTPAPPVPERRDDPTVVWTGTEMIVWGGTGGASGFDSLDSGNRYNPATNTWTPISTVNAPAGRSGQTAIWTGSRMIVWGGSTSPIYGVMNSGGRYDPATDTWSPTYVSSGPSGRSDHTAVWTGSLMIVWGGIAPQGTVDSGGRYDPATDTWSATSLSNAPEGRGGHTAVWTGSHMIVWGGVTIPGYEFLNSGGRYDPISDTWSSTSTTTAPPRRAEHTAVWTGTRMIVWGGWAGYPYLDSGGRYDPATDTWSATATTNAPTGRHGHTAVWTGSEMILWGGSDGNSSPISGSRYDPINDTWAPISTTNSPTGSLGHTAVWTGTRMIAWSGFNAGFLDSGGLYDPTTDTWAPTPITNAPEGRIRHTAVWTGKEMIVWGGSGVSYFDTGGRYDPARNDWSPVSTTHAPTERSHHTAVWTGTEMIVWGGSAGYAGFGSGGRYSPDPSGGSPVVDAGADLVAECAGVNGTVVRLHGAGTGCGPLTFTWTGPFAEGGGSIQGSEAAVTLPLGESAITLRVDDPHGQSAADAVVVTVRDAMPPTLTLRADPPSLWPATHRMVPVHVLGEALDLCDPNPALSLVSVSSSEPDDSPGDGDGRTTGDIEGADLGTADREVGLRAERSATGPGRVYELTFRAVDATGNATPARVTVTVPRNGSLLPQSNAGRRGAVAD